MTTTAFFVTKYTGHSVLVTFCYSLAKYVVTRHKFKSLENKNQTFRTFIGVSLASKNIFKIKFEFYLKFVTVSNYAVKRHNIKLPRKKHKTKNFYLSKSGT